MEQMKSEEYLSITYHRGKGSQRGELETLSAELGIEDKVGFIGLLSRQEVREVMWKLLELR